MRWVSHPLKALDGKASASMVAIGSDLELALLPTMLSRARAWRTSRVRINAQAVFRRPGYRYAEAHAGRRPGTTVDAVISSDARAGQRSISLCLAFLSA